MSENGKVVYTTLDPVLESIDEHVNGKDENDPEFLMLAMAKQAILRIAHVANDLGAEAFTKRRPDSFMLGWDRDGAPSIVTTQVEADSGDVATA